MKKVWLYTIGTVLVSFLVLVAVIGGLVYLANIFTLDVVMQALFLGCVGAIALTMSLKLSHDYWSQRMNPSKVSEIDPSAYL